MNAEEAVDSRAENRSTTAAVLKAAAMTEALKDAVGAVGIEERDKEEVAKALKESAKEALAEERRENQHETEQEEDQEEEEEKPLSPVQSENLRLHLAEGGENYEEYRSQRRAEQKKAWEKLYATVPLNDSPRSMPVRRLSRSSSSSWLDDSRSVRSSKSKQNAKQRTYIKDDDASNCTFQPKINKASKNMVRSSGPFLQRFENSHEAHKNAVETRRAKLEYEKRVDKKTCPKCKSEQSYDEVRSHKASCQRCKVPYRYKVAWNDVGQHFLERVEQKIADREEKLAELEDKTAPPFCVKERMIYDKDFDVVRKVRAEPPATWDQVRESFIHRTESDRKLREAKALLAQRAKENEFNFKPNLVSRPKSVQSAYASSLWGSSGGQGLLSDSFEERMEADTLRRRRELVQSQLRTKHVSALAASAPVNFKFKPAAWEDVQLHTGGVRRRPSSRWL